MQLCSFGQHARKHHVRYGVMHFSRLQVWSQSTAASYNAAKISAGVSLQISSL